MQKYRQNGGQMKKKKRAKCTKMIIVMKTIITATYIQPHGLWLAITRNYYA